MGKDVNAAAESVRLLAEEAVKKDNGGAFAEYVGPDAKFLVARCVCVCARVPCEKCRKSVFCWITFFTFLITNQTVITPQRKKS